MHNNATGNATMSKKRAKEEEEDDEVDWNSVFPTSHIKAQVTNYEEVGRLSNKAAEYVGACSALFFQELVSEAAGSSSSTHVTLEDVRQASTKYAFLKNALDNVTEASAPKLPLKKKPKLDATINEAIAVSEAASSHLQLEITVDQDDYD